MAGENLFWTEGRVDRGRREALLGQRGCIVWLTGLSGSGKSTIAQGLEDRLVDGGHACYVLDGDNVRQGLNRDLGFSPEERQENIRRVGEVALLFADAGLITIVSFISPYRSDRECIRAMIGRGRFVEVYLDVAVDVCEDRDVKGLYKRARAGDIGEFTGVSAPYEPPAAPEVSLKTDQLTVAESVTVIHDYLHEHELV